MESLAKLSSSSNQLVKYTVNILSLTMQFCTFHHYTEAKAKTLGISAILHDIGCTKLPPEIN